MDVDDVDSIPGFGSHKRRRSQSQAMSISNPSSPTTPSFDSEVKDNQESSTSSLTATPGPAPVPPTVPTLSSSSAPVLGDSHSNDESALPTPSFDAWAVANALRPHTKGRTSRKRPVAADFVDDTIPESRSESYTPTLQPPYVRRKLHPFANLRPPRRCIIDLSDSEDEEVSGDESRSSTEPTQSSIPSGSRSVPIQAPRPVRASGGLSNRSVPSPANARSPMMPSGATTPAALLEKEEQIKRMKELIAQRERDKIKKLASVSVLE